MKFYRAYSSIPNLHFILVNESKERGNHNHNRNYCIPLACLLNGKIALLFVCLFLFFLSFLLRDGDKAKEKRNEEDWGGGAV